MIILLTVSIQCSDHCFFFTISAQCSNNQFECDNHDCLPLINHCDGTPQCSDKSDEFRCGMFIFLRNHLYCLLHGIDHMFRNDHLF